MISTGQHNLSDVRVQAVYSLDVEFSKRLRSHIPSQFQSRGRWA